jgi:hypothetical protein
VSVSLIENENHIFYVNINEIETSVSRQNPRPNLCITSKNKIDIEIMYKTYIALFTLQNT